MTDSHNETHNNNEKLSCAVGLCVKNNSVGLPKVFDNIRRLRNIFTECSVIAYYDRSTDNSLDLLKVLSSHYRISTLILNDDASGPVARKRTVNIANARNSILREFYFNPQFANYELFAMMDSNNYSCQGDIYVDVINKYLNTQNGMYDRWDSLSFARKPYYDLWAYSAGPFQIGCWCYPRLPRKRNEITCYQFQDAMREHVDATIFAPENAGNLVEVDSAFCGFALYKKESFRGCFYNGGWSTTYMDKDKACQNLAMYRLVRNNQTDDCEHRHFHMMAKKMRGARIMVACDQAFSEK